MQQVNQLPPGAIQIHLGGYTNCLAPRGSMEKESLSFAIFERLISNLEHWTDEKYGDNPDPYELIDSLIKQSRDELEAALHRFRLEADPDY
jgi:hypothetical protein